MARKKSVPQIQAGRNLPSKFSSYSPGRPANAPQQSSISDRGTVNQAKPKLYKKIIAIFLLTVLACFVIIGAWDARNISSASQKLFGSGNILSFLNASSLKTDANG